MIISKVNKRVQQTILTEFYSYLMSHTSCLTLTNNLWTLPAVIINKLVSEFDFCRESHITNLLPS